MANRAPPILSGIGEIADRYDGYLIDLWGTIHDGKRPLPGVIAALEGLKAAGKHILVISNAPRRHQAVVESLRKIGIPDHLYDDVMSSGEAAYLALRDRTDPWHAALGRICYHLGPTRDSGVLAGLDVTVTDDIVQAKFIVTTGLDAPDETVADYEPILAAGAERGLPMICANPDLVVLRGDSRELCAGALAARYEELGGEVYYHGKPHAPIYDAAFDLLKIADPRKLIMVGDSLRTDIAGARAAGIDSVFVLGGIHGNELGAIDGRRPIAARLRKLFDDAGIAPDHVLPRFVW